MAVKDIEQAVVSFAVAVKDDPGASDGVRKAADELHKSLSGEKDDSDKKD